ncbi:LacI family DNA-binding transcriptional regulator [Herbidospora mongoliensis]|uniref:LacI family DNA-binding transcriptional regulator n=1 Tax=Herbidospora mongoliensis TaxID=688067 RepID=UPI00082FA1E6|nr:LacI family DNA-binding transcriptional regulator [Herbidospora mongoliensis]
MDVARRAGVSHQTVSRFLRGNGGLKPVTLALIEQAIADLDYRPNLVARSMRTRRSNRIMVVLPAVTSFVPVQTLGGASAEAHAAGYMIDIVGLEGSEKIRGDRVRSLLDSGQADGVLAFTPLGEIADARPGGPPTVVVGAYDDNLRSQGFLASGGAAADIVDHLASLGHRRFLHVAGNSDWASARNRRDVYLETIKARGLESYAVVDGDWSVQSGYDTARDLPDASGVTAVVAANDFVAMGVIRGFQDRGWRVPRDVSVFGWDNEQFTQYFSPSISTVDLDRVTLGRQSMRVLLARMAGDPDPGFRPHLHPRLIFRESTAAPPS